MIPKKEKESDKKMDTKKIAATFAILMLTLGVAGFAYAHWSEFVYIEGEVTTGCLDLEWSFDYDLIQDKPVAYIEYLIEEPYLYVGLYNAYPCLTVELWIDVNNTGSIPVKLLSYDCGTSGDDLTPWIEIIDEDFYGTDGNGDGIYGSLEQLDPCDTVVYYVKLHFMQENAAGELLPEDAYMDFWYNFEWVNWNYVIPL